MSVFNSLAAANVKGIVVFMLVGPPLGLVTALLAVIPLITIIAGGEVNIEPLAFVVLLPLSYLIGLVPAAVAGFIDAFLAWKAVRYRLAWITFIGFFATFLPVVPSFVSGYIHGPGVLIGGIIGAVPALLCSWLAAKATRASPDFADTR